MLSVDSKNDNVDDTAEPRLIATESLVNAAELLCCNGNVDDNENFCSQLTDSTH